MAVSARKEGMKQQFSYAMKRTFSSKYEHNNDVQEALSQKKKTLFWSADPCASEQKRNVFRGRLFTVRSLQVLSVRSSIHRNLLWNEKKYSTAKTPPGESIFFESRLGPCSKKFIIVKLFAEKYCFVHLWLHTRIFGYPRTFSSHPVLRLEQNKSEHSFHKIVTVSTNTSNSSTGSVFL